ncbi:MAG: peptidoglycan editing factor PgeF [bacterium]
MRNSDLFPEKGFSISNLDYYTEYEIDTHRRFLANELGYEIDKLKFQKQVHGTDIQIVSSQTPNGLETDGMITSEKGVILNVSIADCLAVLIYDPVNQVIAGIHSGWKGTKENIAKKGIRKLVENFSSNPENLLVYLSPCASGRKYVVGYDVAQFFPLTSVQINEEKYLFDNRKQVYGQLIESGVRARNIEVSDICTIENTNYHSFRRDSDKSGRMSSFIGLKS